MSEAGTLEHILDCEDWKSKQKHIFILSSAGKPVYSRYGSEEKLVTLFGVMQALVSVTQDMDDDSIEAIYFGSRTLVFSVRGPIILVAVSSTREPISFLNKQLSYVYSQIVSVLTLSQVTRIFEERRNYDLRRLLTGSERLIDSLLKSTELEPDLLVNGVSCLPLPLNSREAISNTIISTCSKIK
uniref:Vacuolar fusion protein MON1 homolog n=3 Tax=Rhodnius TaxID=13248 RepID=T1I7L5_RHOPR